jgi:hypothetical protein
MQNASSDRSKSRTNSSSKGSLGSIILPSLILPCTLRKTA